MYNIILPALFVFGFVLGAVWMFTIMSTKL